MRTPGSCALGDFIGIDTTFYVDFERIRKHDGYVYFWRIRDDLKPDKWGDLSARLNIGIKLD